MPERNPKTDPQFGDVFRFDGEDYPWTVFLCRGEGRSVWWGLDLYPTNAGRLHTPRVTDFEALPTGDGWSFVEHIGGLATGGPMTTYFTSWGTVMHHLDGDSSNNSPENLVEVPLMARGTGS